MSVASAQVPDVLWRRRLPLHVHSPYLSFGFIPIDLTIDDAAAIDGGTEQIRVKI
jgi:hypothetical protein